MCPVQCSWTGRYKTILHGGIAFGADARFLGGQQFVSPGTQFRSLPLALFLHALEETNRRADEIKTLAKLVLEEPLVAEMQAL